MSSEMPAMCGSSSDTQAPLCPYCLNLRVVPKSFGLSLVNESMKAKRLPAISESGMRLVDCIFEASACNRKARTGSGLRP